jgi:hypothetical protein
MSLNRLVRGRQTNAAIGWVATGAVALGGVENLVADATLWGVFLLVVAAALAVPALATREWTAMVSWPLPVVAVAAVVARETGFQSELAGHLALATLALVLVVELDVFTSVELSRRFAVVFGVLTTMALQAVWVVAQFYSDRWLGSEFLSTQTELQRDIVAVTAVGAVLGALCEVYFARYGPVGAVGESTDRRETS